MCAPDVPILSRERRVGRHDADRILKKDVGTQHERSVPVVSCRSNGYASDGLYGLLTPDGFHNDIRDFQVNTTPTWPWSVGA
jgi:hypothetical protein